MLVILDSLWKRIAGAVSHACAMDDGRVGQALGELFRYLAEEVSNGLYYGFRDAIGMQEKGRIEVYTKEQNPLSLAQ